MTMLDEGVFNFGMNSLEFAFNGAKFNREAYWLELKDMGSFEFMRGVEHVIKTEKWADALIAQKIRKGANV